MSILQNSNAISAGGAYNITDSLRFRSSASAYLTRTPTTAGNLQTWTWSGWVKRGTLGTSQDLFAVDYAPDNQNFHWIGFNTSNQIDFGLYPTGVTARLTTTQVFRDTSAWYHIVAVWDTTNATANNRMRLYINGVEVTSFSTRTNPTQNTNGFINTVNLHTIGDRYFNNSHTNFFDGYQTEINFVDGQALTPSDFGETNDNGAWSPKKYTGTYGTNGFYLPMKETTQATGFNTVLYTGNGTSQDITGVGFTPDLVWHKGRSVAYYHSVVDSIRGDSNVMFPNATNAEQNPGDQLDIITDGFTTTYRSANLANNQSGATYVAWCWDAGDTTVSNTDGTITSTVRANPASGFSIVTFTSPASGAYSVGHGLGTAPSMVITKRRDSTSNWWTWHTSLGDNTTDYLSLNTTNAEASLSGMWGTVGRDADVIGYTAGTSTSGGSTQVAYCFSEVSGYSKFGSYTGNGSTSGPTVTTGFRPAFVMIKGVDSARSWNIYDNTRDVDNPIEKALYPNNSDAETTAGDVDFTDTGFEIKNTGTVFNISGEKYIYMAFADTRDYQWNFDASGNKNNWTPNNINSNASSEPTYDLMSDVPSLADEDTANFATWNPLTAGGLVTFTEANLKASSTSSASPYNIESTVKIPSTGKWYAEVDVLRGASNPGVGIGNNPATSNSNLDQWANYRTNGTYSTGNMGASSSGTPSTYTTGDVIGVAYDADAGTLSFYKNGVAQTGGYTGITSGNYSFIVRKDSASGDGGYLNCGQRPFAYTPPTGYKKLNTYNLPDSSITDGSQYMNTLIWTGDNTSPRSLTGVGFSPDLTWIKRRNSVKDHALFDSVRGSTLKLESNTTIAEITGDNGKIDSFDSDGFTISTGTTDNSGVNSTSNTFVAWNWRGSDSTAVSNTDGTITSTVSANTTSGFSVVTYTGNGTTSSTVGHGLGSTPKVVITKNRTNAGNWRYWTTTVDGSFDYLFLNTTAAKGDVSGITAPTSSIFMVGNNADHNGSGQNYVAYCFADVEGFSKFGSYTGNGSTDGPFVYTGFKPAFVMFKPSSRTGNWYMFDVERNTYNLTNLTLFPHLSNAESLETNNVIDILSNGFKHRGLGAFSNESGATYIYMCFAQNPFKNSLAQ